MDKINYQYAAAKVDADLEFAEWRLDFDRCMLILANDRQDMVLYIHGGRLLFFTAYTATFTLNLIDLSDILNKKIKERFDM